MPKAYAKRQRRQVDAVEHIQDVDKENKDNTNVTDAQPKPAKVVRRRRKEDIDPLNDTCALIAAAIIDSVDHERKSKERKTREKQQFDEKYRKFVEQKKKYFAEVDAFPLEEEVVTTAEKDISIKPVPSAESTVSEQSTQAAEVSQDWTLATPVVHKRQETIRRNNEEIELSTIVPPLSGSDSDVDTDIEIKKLCEVLRDVCL